MFVEPRPAAGRVEHLDVGLKEDEEGCDDPDGDGEIPGNGGCAGVRERGIHERVQVVTSHLIYLIQRHRLAKVSAT